MQSNGVKNLNDQLNGIELIRMDSTRKTNEIWKTYVDVLEEYCLSMLYQFKLIVEYYIDCSGQLFRVILFKGLI